VKSIVEGNGNFEGKTDRDGKEFCKIDFVGWIVSDGELLVISNPNNIDFVSIFFEWWWRAILLNFCEILRGEFVIG
jgi:hypothetical protein